jgi:hypothetical protein
MSRDHMFVTPRVRLRLPFVAGYRNSACPCAVGQPEQQPLVRLGLCGRDATGCARDSRGSAGEGIRSGATMTAKRYARRYGVDPLIVHDDLTALGFVLSASAHRWERRSPAMAGRCAVRPTRPRTSRGSWWQGSSSCVTHRAACRTGCDALGDPPLQDHRTLVSRAAANRGFILAPFSWAAERWRGSLAVGRSGEMIGWSQSSRRMSSWMKRST